MGKGLREIYEGLLSKLPPELQDLKYETISVEEVHVKKPRKVYRYIHLKGYRDGKTYTLRSYPLGSVYMPELVNLVYLYRAVKALEKALSYLSLLETSGYNL